MNKLITNLSAELACELEKADEVLIAVALLNDSGFNFLRERLKNNCRVRLLVGIDLPTTPNVLKNLFEDKNIKTRVYSNDKYFHPKLYIFKKEGKLKIFVGSSNFTNGGLKDNIELTLLSVDENACNDAINWFNKVFDSSSLLTKEFLDQYEAIYLNRKVYEDAEKEKRKKLKGLLKPSLDDCSLDLLNDDFYFVKDDYLTFHPDKASKDTPEFRGERERVRQKMFRLEKLLYAKIKERDWGIYRHPNTNNRVSLIEIKYNKNYVNSIWLHFGKKGKERYGSFIENMRLQVIVSGNLRLTNIGYGVGVWLMIGKESSSFEDRNYIRKNIEKSNFFEKLYDYVLSLGEGYFLQLNNENYACNLIQRDVLYELIKKDNYESYFIIGKNFCPVDELLRRDNILNNIMNEFEKLYPLYEFLKI